MTEVPLVKLPSGDCHWTSLMAQAQVMVWCHQATSRYLSWCWPSSMSPYGPQCVNISRSETKPWTLMVTQYQFLISLAPCRCGSNFETHFSEWHLSHIHFAETTFNWMPQGPNDNESTIWSSIKSLTETMRTTISNVTCCHGATMGWIYFLKMLVSCFKHFCSWKYAWYHLQNGSHFVQTSMS